MQNMFSRIKNPALRYGLIFGLILFAVEIVLTFVGGLLGAFISLLSLAAFVVLPFLAGQRASQETGKLKTGLLAGLWTGVFGQLFYGILILIITLFNLDTYRRGAQDYARSIHQSQSQINAITNAAYINNLLLQLAINIVIASLLGLLAGAVGGYFGRRRAAPPSEPYQEAMFEPPSSTRQ